MANMVYNAFKMNVLSGNIDLTTSDVFVALLSGGFSGVQAHSVYGDLSGEVVSAGYTQSGMLIPNTTVTLDNIDNEAVLSGDNVTFSGLTASVGYGVVYISGATPAAKYLIGSVDFGGTQTLTAADLTITWDATEGIFNLM